MDRERTVDIHYPFVDVASHVEQAVVVWCVLVNVDGDVTKIIQGTSHTHVVTTTLHEVGIDLSVASVAVVTISHKVSIPWIGLSLENEFVLAVPNQTKSSVFPFSFGRQAIAWQQDAILDSNVSEFRASTKARQPFPHAIALVLAREVSVRCEMFFVDLGGRTVSQQTLSDENSLIDAI